MKPHQYAFFLVLALVVFFFYATTRTTIVGADSAAFLGYSCGIPPIGKGGGQIGEMAYGIPFSAWFFSALPCNQLLFKAIACLNLLICVIILAKTGELFDKENGWMLGLFAFLNGIFLTHLLDFEEEQLGLPFLFLACYFLLRHIKFKDSWNLSLGDHDLLLGMLFVGLSGCFWKGAIYLLPLFGLYFLPALILFVFSLPFVGTLMFGAITAGLSELYGGIVLGKQVMQEAMIGIGFIHQSLMLLGLLNRNKTLWLALIYALALAFLAQRFSLLPLSFIGVAFIAYLKDKPQLRQIFLIVTIGFIAFSLFLLPKVFPDNKQITAIQNGVALANGKPICNQFGAGWWIKLYGGQTDYFSGFPDCNIETWHGTVIDSNKAYFLP